MNVTRKERLKRKEREQEETMDKALKRILSFSRSTNLSYSSNPWGEGLVFEESGRARLANISGFLKGLMVQEELSPLAQLAQTGSETTPKKLARLLAWDLDEQLRRLANYGGEREIVVEEYEDGTSRKVTVPAYRVVLCDDGTFGGFSVLWHKPFGMEDVKGRARALDEDAYQGHDGNGNQLSEEESRKRWEDAVAKAEGMLRLRKGLEITRHWTPRWVERERAKAEALHEEHKPEGYSSAIYGCDHEDCLRSRDRLRYSGRNEYVRYGFAFNGGLLLHGFGPTFSVDMSGNSRPHWSVHT